MPRELRSFEAGECRSQIDSRPRLRSYRLESELPPSSGGWIASGALDDLKEVLMLLTETYIVTGGAVEV